MPNLVKIGWTAAEIWRFFDFFKMAAVRHLGFVMPVWGPPTKGIRWSLSLCKIWLESMQQFWKYGRFSISRVWLENAYSRPKIKCFGGFWPPIWEAMWKIQKRHILARVRIVWAIMRENPSRCLTCRCVPQKRGIVAGNNNRGRDTRFILYSLFI